MWRVREPVRLGSAGALKVGRFARIVQAMNLLTMSTRVAAEDKLDMLSTQEHFVQLDRALRALSTLNATETELRSTLFCVPHTICVEYVCQKYQQRKNTEAKQCPDNAP
jgi:hypothetical protein